LLYRGRPAKRSLKAMLFHKKSTAAKNIATVLILNIAFIKNKNNGSIL